MFGNIFDLGATQVPPDVGKFADYGKLCISPMDFLKTSLFVLRIFSEQIKQLGMYTPSFKVDPLKHRLPLEVDRGQICLAVLGLCWWNLGPGGGKFVQNAGGVRGGR